MPPFPSLAMLFPVTLIPLITASPLDARISKNVHVDDYNNDTMFERSAGSPPLIVAFLLIGVFTIVMAIVFGWRRRRDTRELAAVAGGHRRQRTTAHDEPRQGRTKASEKPQLWDVCMRVPESNKGSGAGHEILRAKLDTEEAMWKDIVVRPCAVLSRCPNRGGSGSGL